MNLESWNDRQVEQFIALLLRTGVIIAACVVAIGGLVYLARNSNQTIDYKSFHSEVASLKSVSGIADAVVAHSGRAIIQLGLILLICTPVARVAFSVLAFAVEKDWLYVSLTIAVLLILTYSLVGSG